MSKGETTKAAILGEATDLASVVGLGGLTIGTLATASHLSKSGLYAHFESKEMLQVQVLQYARERFTDAVLRPTVSASRGEPRLRSFFEHWIEWQDSGLPGGCVFVDAASEFDDRDGPVRDELIRAERDRLESVAMIVKTGIAEGQFRDDVDAEQVAYELQGIVLAHHHARRLMRDAAAGQRAHRAFERLLASCRVTAPGDATATRT